MFDDDDDDDNGKVCMYILAPITVIVVIGVCSYIYIQSKRLNEEMKRNGQLINVMPALFTSVHNWQTMPNPVVAQNVSTNFVTPVIPSGHVEQIPQPPTQSQSLYSPKGYPTAPPPYTE